MAVPFDAGILLRKKKGLLGQLNFRLHIIQKKIEKSRTHREA